jgi:hypothetical protein
MASTLPRFKRMKRIPGGKRRGLPELTGADPKIAEREPDELQKIVNTLGGTAEAAKIAKRVLKLKPEFPAASLPELVTYIWLTDNKIPFHFQAQLFGGRRAKGGILPDFVVQYGGKGMAWQIQGEYWHRKESAHGRKDLTSNLRMLGQDYKGIRIDDVVELWENDIARRRPQVFTSALQGQGLRE